jgi:hypothetical protein
LSLASDDIISKDGPNFPRRKKVAEIGNTGGGDIIIVE